MPVPLTVLDSKFRDITGPVLDYVAAIRGAKPRDLVVVYLPEYVVGHWWEHLLHNQSALRLKARLRFQPGAMVTNVRWIWARPSVTRSRRHQLADGSPEASAPERRSGRRTDEPTDRRQHCGAGTDGRSWSGRSRPPLNIEGPARAPGAASPSPLRPYNWAGEHVADGEATVGPPRLAGPGYRRGRPGGDHRGLGSGAQRRVTLTSIALLYLVPVVIAAGVGGVWVGLAASIGSDALLNWFFVPPYHTLAVDRRDNLVALLVYVLVAVAVAVAVDLAARQRAAAARSGVEAQLLGRITAEPLEGQALPRLLGHIRDTFAMTSVALLESVDSGPEHIVAAVGPPVDAANARLSARAGNGLRLVAAGPELFAEDRRLLGQLAAAAARTLEATRQADHAAQLAEVDRVRTAILAAVGHDLRTPLASIKAAASSLRAPDVEFTEEDRAELLATVEESTDRLDELVENLLAMSRLQAGVMSVRLRPVALDAVVAQAMRHAAPGATSTYRSATICRTCGPTQVCSNAWWRTW